MDAATKKRDAQCFEFKEGQEVDELVVWSLLRSLPMQQCNTPPQPLPHIH